MSVLFSYVHAEVDVLIWDGSLVIRGVNSQLETSPSLSQALQLFRGSKYRMAATLKY